MIFSLLFLMVPSWILPQANDTIYLWPDRIQMDIAAVPTVLPDRGDGVIRITDVTNPAILVFTSNNETKNTGAAVLVSPGGAIRHLTMNGRI